MNSIFNDAMNDYQEPVDMGEEIFSDITAPVPPKDYGPKPTNPRPVQATSKEEFGHVVEPAPKTDDDFHKALKQSENGIQSGRDEESGLWQPHSSLEGGTDTLGYGHKLTPRESKGRYVMLGGKQVPLKDGLDDIQIDELYQQDVGLARKRLEKSIDGFENLPRNYQHILTNISFNTGEVQETGWPNLLRSMREGDNEGVRREMVTSYKDKDGNRKQLTERAATIADATLA